LNVKPIYTVPELARMMGISRQRAARLLARAKVPIHVGMPGIVYLSDIKACAPEIWTSLEEAAHIRSLAG